MPTERQAIRKWMQENPERAATLKDLFDKGLLHGMEEAIAVDEPLTMICGPESGGILGSRRAKCECGATIWLSPSSRKVLRARGAAPTRLMCMRCGGQALENDLKTGKN